MIVQCLGNILEFEFYLVIMHTSLTELVSYQLVRTPLNLCSPLV